MKELSVFAGDCTYGRAPRRRLRQIHFDAKTDTGPLGVREVAVLDNAGPAGALARPRHLELRAEQDRERQAYIGNRRAEIVGCGRPVCRTEQALEIVLIIQFHADRKLRRDVVGGTREELDGAAFAPRASFALPDILDIDVAGQT